MIEPWTEQAMRYHANHRWDRLKAPIQSAVSLSEVLVVCSIILFLLALLVPGLARAKEQARRVQCASNLKQWGVALQFYRDENNDYIPMEGTAGSTAPFKHGAWYNELPPYLDMPAYRDVEGVNKAIREFKNGHFWVCPSKELTDAYKSFTGKNQFHYGMNTVLDGMGPHPQGSADTPGFPDPKEAKPLPAKLFVKKPQTVFLFDIAPNLPRGSPRDVATMYYRYFDGRSAGRFHGDFANFLFLDVSVFSFTTSDLVAGRDLRHDAVIWNHPQLYWGYPPPG